MTRTQDVLDDLAEWYSTSAISAAAGDGASAPRSLFGALPQVSRKSAGRGLVPILEALLAWHDRARQRRTLMELSDDMLRDIGISRAEALGEAQKPFWRV